MSRTEMVTTDKIAEKIALEALRHSEIVPQLMMRVGNVEVAVDPAYMTQSDMMKQPDTMQGGEIRVQADVMMHPQETTIKRPDVSVLIPAYNCKLTLHRAVESALKQEGVSVQVVICDDKSTDGTAVLALNMALEDQRIALLHHSENQRIAAALNTAGSRATGRYIIRCDSDDWLGKNSLAPFVAALDANPDVGFVYGARQYYGRRSDIYRPKPFNRADFDLHNAAGYCYLFRRQIWDDGLRWRALGIFGGAVIDLEDWQHLQAMLALGYPGLAMPEVLALHYTFRWEGTWSELQANQPAALAEFKRLWPNVRAESL